MLLRVIISLAAVFGLLFYLRKRLGARFGAPEVSQLKIVERHSVGPKSSVVLLDVQGRRYILGVSESSVNLLDSFEANEPAVPEEAENTAGSSRAFAAVLESQGKPLIPSEAKTKVLPAANASTTAGNSVLEPHSNTPTSLPGPLTGSILSPDTWRRAAAAIRQGRGA